MSGDFQESLIEQLRPALSDARLSTYLAAAGFDAGRALRLYLWNAQVGEAFHLSIQAVEVALRNTIDVGLSQQFGTRWWVNADYQALIDDQRKADLDQVVQRIRNRRLELESGQVVAGLSFGFWVGMLDRRYSPVIWSKGLRAVFVHLPRTRNLKSLREAARLTLQLRNRIWHHEPVISRDLSAEHARINSLLTWLSPPMAAFIAPHCRVQQLLRQKP